MKTIFLLVLTAVWLQSSAQLTKTFNSHCACTIVTNRFDVGTKSSEHSENSAGEKHGIETVYFPDGSKQLERNWTNGKLNGQGKHYHRNGNVYFESHHVEGNKTGLWTFKNEEGDIIQTINHGDGDGQIAYVYYHTGVKYFMQVLKHNKLEREEVLNKKIYKQLKLEASSQSKR